MFNTIVLLVLLNRFHLIFTQDFKTVCYMKADPEIPVDYIIRAQLCSHIIVGFVSVVDSVIEVDDTNDKFFKRCKSTINEINGQTFLMFSIGGKYLIDCLIDSLNGLQKGELY